MHTLNITTTFERNGVTLRGQASVSGGAVVDIDEPMTTGSLILNQTIDVSALKAILVVCDVDGVVLEFNGDGDPQFVTANLNANEPFAWNNRSGLANPFGSTDVTSISFSGDPVATRVQMTICTDPTP